MKNVSKIAAEILAVTKQFTDEERAYLQQLVHKLVKNKKLTNYDWLSNVINSKNKKFGPGVFDLIMRELKKENQIDLMKKLDNKEHKIAAEILNKKILYNIGYRVQELPNYMKNNADVWMTHIWQVYNPFDKHIKNVRNEDEAWKVAAEDWKKNKKKY